MFPQLMHSVQWHPIVTVAQPGDPTDDSTLPWPPDRRRVDVGTLAIQTLREVEHKEPSAIFLFEIENP